jgi:hypothetical protein
MTDSSSQLSKIIQEGGSPNKGVHLQHSEPRFDFFQTSTCGILLLMHCPDQLESLVNRTIIFPTFTMKQQQMTTQEGDAK